MKFYNPAVRLDLRPSAGTVSSTMFGYLRSFTSAFPIRKAAHIPIIAASNGFRSAWASFWLALHDDKAGGPK